MMPKIDPETIGPLLHGTARAWRLKLDERLKPMGLSQAKWRTLLHLSVAPGPLTQAEIAALLVFSALENGDRAGLLLFTDRIERYVPPRRGKKHGLRLITETLAFRPQGRGTDLAAALGHLSRAQRRSAVVFVVSDFLADAYEQPLAVLARRHDVIPVVLSDPVEEKLPDVGGLWPIADAETGETVLVDLSDEGTRRAWEARAAERVQKRERTFRRLSLEAVRVRPGDDYVAPLAALFRARTRRRSA